VSTTSTRAARVQRYQDEFVSPPKAWEPVDAKEQALAGYRASLANAIDALTEGEHAESAAWSAIGNLIGLRYRKVI
jgi:hypothetical protein